MKYRWLLVPVIAFQLVSARAAETLSVDFPDITMKELGKHLAVLFPVSVELPPDFVDFKKSLLLRDVTWDQILSEAFDGSDFYCVVMPTKAVVLKRGDPAPLARYREFLPGTWGPQRKSDAAPIDEVQREFRADGSYEVTLVSAAGGPDGAKKVLGRGQWTLRDDRLELVVTETLDPNAGPDAAAGIWEVRTFRYRTALFSNPRSGLSLLLQRRDL